MMEMSEIATHDGMYRYELRRVWDESKPLLLFIGLNPSCANDLSDDNTSRVCINYAKRWGFGGLVMANLFAYRTPKPSELFDAQKPIGGENNEHLQRLQKEVGLVVCAWGNDGVYLNRNLEVLSFLKQPYSLKILKSGQPGHPLYKSSKINREDLILMNQPL